MKERNTREKIMLAALDLFSTKGYGPVSVREIAGAVGIKESSLYNHFKGKQELFDSIVEEYAERVGAMFSQHRLAGEDGTFAVDARTVEMYKGMTNEQFLAVTGAVFDRYFADEIGVKLRRMLTIEQYRDERLTKLYRKISFEDGLAYQEALFAEMMKEGLFVRADPAMLALAFLAPVFLIFHRYDNTPEKLGEARELFLRHVRHFNETYAVRK